MSRPFAFYSNAALRELEQRAQRVAGMDEDTLMRRAGQAAWQQLLHMWPQAHRITVLCGPGNNGGDGWVLAAHALESGRDVRVVRLGDGAPRTALARVMAAAYHHAGGGEDAFDGVLPEADVLAEEFAAASGYSVEEVPAESANAGFKDWFLQRFRRPGFTIEAERAWQRALDGHPEPAPAAGRKAVA